MLNKNLLRPKNISRNCLKQISKESLHKRRILNKKHEKKIKMKLLEQEEVRWTMRNWASSLVKSNCNTKFFQNYQKFIPRTF